eukprot:2157688-Amphidinium_carterae.1
MFKTRHMPCAPDVAVTNGLPTMLVHQALYFAKADKYRQYHVAQNGSLLLGDEKYTVETKIITSNFPIFPELMK